MRLIFAALWVENAEFKEIMQALYLGIKFDVRLAILFNAPLLLLIIIPKYNLISCHKLYSLACIYITIATFLLVGAYILDCGYYAYTGNRIDILALRFFEDAATSWQMVWESYPVILITSGWILVSSAICFINIKLINKYRKRPAKKITTTYKIIVILISLIALILGLYGKLATTPLRWSEAFEKQNPSLIALGLNPILYFFDTRTTQQPQYDLSIIKNNHHILADYLDISKLDAQNLNFVRHVPAQNTPTTGMNVIFIMLESMGSNRLGFFGNPLMPTPNLDKIAHKSIVFKNFFVPAVSTARSVFSSLTGIPDVSRSSTASRNPLIVKQHLIANDFTDYKKYYFIGGHLGWANIRGLLKHNINDLVTYEDHQYKSSSVDAWGISDADLLFESLDILEQTSQPIFAYIQTAGNHEPFTIPTKNYGFNSVEHDKMVLKKAGFLSNKQLNGVRLADHSIGKFIEKFTQSSLANNTILVMFGDHNHQSTLDPKQDVDTSLGIQSHRVPLIIYAPNKLKPQIITTPTSLIDLMPTIASMLGIEYKNQTLGRDVLNLTKRQQASAIILMGSEFNPFIGIYEEDTFFKTNASGTQYYLYDLQNNKPSKLLHSPDKNIISHKINLAHTLYHTAGYMLNNNQ